MQSVDELPTSVGFKIWRELSHFAFGSFLAELIEGLMPEASIDHDLFMLWCELETDLQSEGMSFDLATSYLKKVLAQAGYAVPEKIMHPDEPATKQGLDALVDFTQSVIDKPIKSARFFLEII
mgnify:FL=1